MIKDFFRLPPLSTLSCKYLHKFSKKFETTLKVYSGAWGKLIREKTRRRKSRDTVPLKEKSRNIGVNTSRTPTTSLSDKNGQEKCCVIMKGDGNGS
jgi:hypothetical protein